MFMYDTHHKKIKGGEQIRTVQYRTVHTDSCIKVIFVCTYVRINYLGIDVPVRTYTIHISTHYKCVLLIVVFYYRIKIQDQDSATVTPSNSVKRFY